MFSNHALPIRFVLNFRPWLFVVAVGFAGTLAGNFAYKRLLLRPNPPNVSEINSQPKRDPAERPPARHPHAPDE